MSSLDLTGSVVIGALVLMVLFGIFFYYTNYSQVNLENEIAQRDVVVINEIMDRDFNNVGNVVNGGIDPNQSILTASATDFKFQAQMNSSLGLETIRYYRVIEENKDTFLVRSSNESGTDKSWKMKINKMEFSYLDEDGNVPVNTSAIRSISVSINFNKKPNESTSPEKGIYSIPVWYHRKFYPRNLY